MKQRVILLLLVAALSVSCGSTQPQTATIRKVKCEAVSSAADHREVATFPGRIAAAADVNLSFRIAGVIDRVVVSEGAFVRKGEVIAVMDSRDYELQLRATEAEERGIRAEAERVIALYEDRSTTENNYDKAVNGLKQIEAKLEAHRNALNDTRLRAPFDGYIQKRHFEGGEAVSAGMPIVAFVSSGAPEIVINIPSKNYIKRNSISAVSAVVDIYPNEVFNLTQIGVAPKANLNQLYATRLVIEPIEGVDLGVGMSAMVTIEYREDGDDMVSIPMVAVVEGDGKSSVWIIEQGRVKRRAIEVESFTRGGRALVKSGLELGEVVVTAGVASLKEGERVEVLEPMSKSNIGGVL